MAKQKEYIAIPESIYKEIRAFLGTRPYEQVQGVIRALDTASKKVTLDEVPENNAEG